MPPAPPIEEVVAALAEAWSRHPVTDGFALDAARVLDGGIEVGFHWRLDPQRYLVRFSYPGWIREAVGEGFGAEDAVTELGFWLMEELDTGFVGRADRHRVGDAVLLVDRPHRPSGWFVGRVPLQHSPATAERARARAAATGESFVVVADGLDDREPIADPGRFLDRAGLDGSPGRTAAADGSLISWLQIDRGGLGSARAGQAVVVRVDDRTARIAVLELATSDPAALADLVLAACRDAVEAGAHELVADRALTALLSFGFHDDGERLVARFDELHRPDRAAPGAPA